MPLISAHGDLVIAAEHCGHLGPVGQTEPDLTA